MIRKIMVRKIVLIAMMFLLIGAYTLAAPALAGDKPTDDQFTEKNWVIGEKFNYKNSTSKEEDYIIDLRTADVTGDQVEDKVLLVGNKLFNDNDIYADNLKIIIEDGSLEDGYNDKYRKASYEGFSGYEARLFIGDFTGDQIDDVMVTAATGGSGGISNHLIASFVDNKAEVIFSKEDNAGLVVGGRYRDGFKADLTITVAEAEDEIKKEKTLDLYHNINFYLESGTYNQKGKLLKEVRPISYPFTTLDAVDYDLDGVYELVGSQRVVGVASIDTVSHIESVWEYREESWQVNQYYFFNINGFEFLKK